MALIPLPGDHDLEPAPLAGTEAGQEGLLPPEADRAIRLTSWGMWWEALARAFWPAFVWGAGGIAALALGLGAALPGDWLGTAVMVWAAILVAGLGFAAWRMRRPRLPAVVARVDQTLPGRPLAALNDALAVGADHPGSLALWRAHLAQMWDAARRARPSRPAPGLARRDPLALRLAALTALVMAILFGADPLGQGVGAVASTFREPPPGVRPVPETRPGWEGWAAPPDYIRRPVIYMNALPEGEVLNLPEGSRLSFRLYGEGAGITQDIGTPDAEAPPEAPVFVAEQSGSLTVAGRRFAIEVLPDAAPTISPGAAPQRRADGRLIQRFRAADDNGVTKAEATVALDLGAVDRRYGLTIDPEAREPVVINLPLSGRGRRTEIDGNLVSDLSQHPWANLPVTISLSATDGAGQQGSAPPMKMVLPGRRFFDPLAAALIEVRRDLLWSGGNAAREAEILRAVSWQPEEFIEQPLQTTLTDVIAKLEGPELTPEARDGIAQTLWDAAVELEDGGLTDALERMQRAQERLSEAIRNGASPDEIRRLMEELKRATDEYTRMLAEQGQPDPNERFVQNQQRQQITADQIQQMMDEIERLMNEGRMAEAQELLEQFNRMMENLQVTQNGQGGGQGGPGGPGGSQRELTDSLREQQRLADEAMRQLQGNDGQQPRPGQPGQSGQPGQGQGQGLGGGQGGQGGTMPGFEGIPGLRGDRPGGEGQNQPGGPGEDQPGGEGQQPDSPGGQDGPLPGQDDSQQSGEPGEGDLASRQEALRREIERQRQMLPGPGTEGGETARDQMDRAAEAMEDAERALREGDLSGAMDSQADAIEAMREGLRALNRLEGEQRRAEADEGQGGEGENPGGEPGGRERALVDPMGRQSGDAGVPGENDGPGNPDGDIASNSGEVADGGGAAARAQALLGEIRRRTGQTSRSTEERDYLQRLLDLF